MVLRKFMRHVTDQNWIAVGLDILVVITGIFLGMQVNEWNDNRKDQLRSKQLVHQMVDDTRVAIHNVDRQIFNNRARIEVDLEALGILDGETLVNDNIISFERALNNISKMSQSEIGVGLLSSLLSGKEIDILPCELLSKAIRSFEDRVQTNAAIIDHFISRIDIENMVLGRYFAFQARSLPNLKVRYDLDRLRHSTEFIYAFQSSISLQTVQLERLELIKGVLENLQTALVRGSK